MCTYVELTKDKIIKALISNYRTGTQGQQALNFSTHYTLHKDKRPKKLQTQPSPTTLLIFNTGPEHYC